MEMYYHVYIEHHDPSGNGQKETYELDLSMEELNENIVKPYHNGETFMCGGQPIDPSFIDVIRISKTGESAHNLLPKLKAEEDKKSAETGIGWGWSVEYLVIDYGSNVTREFIKHAPTREPAPAKVQIIEAKQPSKNIFIVHGTDLTPVKELKSIIEEAGLNPIVLHEQASKGMTIIEKLEKYSNVGFAFIILTPDDSGVGKVEVERQIPSILAKKNLTIEDCVKDHTKLPPETLTEIGQRFFSLLKDRARQNVVLEFGYFMGKLSRERVCCLYKGNIELPSDMQGICYVHFNDSVNEVKGMILKELREAGYEIRT